MSDFLGPPLDGWRQIRRCSHICIMSASELMQVARLTSCLGRCAHWLDLSMPDIEGERPSRGGFLRKLMDLLGLL